MAGRDVQTLLPASTAAQALLTASTVGRFRGRSLRRSVASTVGRFGGRSPPRWVARGFPHAATPKPYRHTRQEYRTDTLYKNTVPMPLALISHAIPPTMPTHKTRIPYRHTIQEYRADAPGINKPCHPPNRADTQDKHTVPTHYTRIPCRCAWH